MGSLAGYGIGYGSGKIQNPEESIKNSSVGSSDRHNYESWFNVTFENGGTGMILIVGLIVVFLCVIVTILQCLTNWQKM